MVRPLIYKALFILSLFIPFAVQAESIRVVIFSAPFGAGHNSAQKRVAELLRKLYGGNIEVIEKNTLDFSPGWISKKAVAGFGTVQSDLPKVYTRIFNKYLKQFEHVKAISEGGKLLYQKLRISPEAVEAYLLNGCQDAQQPGFKDAKGNPLMPTIVISTWPGSTEVLITLKNQKGLWFTHSERGTRKIRTVHVQTDHGTDRYFRLLAEGSDAVCVPSQSVYDEYERLGLTNLTNVQMTGMPLILSEGGLPSYEERTLERREANIKLGLDPELKTVMIEAGKTGAANYIGILASTILAAKGQKLNFIANCGEDPGAIKQSLIKAFIKGAKRGTPEFAALYKEINELVRPINFKSFMRKEFDVFSIKPTLTRAQAIEMIESGIAAYANVIPVGFTAIDPLRKASHVVVTKPGGLSTAELGANGYAMIIMQEYASGEALPNGPLFERLKLAFVNRDVTFIGDQIVNFFSDQSKQREMYAASAEFRTKFDLKKIVPLVEEAHREEVEAAERATVERGLKEEAKKLEKAKKNPPIPQVKTPQNFCAQLFAA